MRRYGTEELHLGTIKTKLIKSKTYPFTLPALLTVKLTILLLIMILKSSIEFELRFLKARIPKKEV